MTGLWHRVQGLDGSFRNLEKFLLLSLPFAGLTVPPSVFVLANMEVLYRSS